MATDTLNDRALAELLVVTGAAVALPRFRTALEISSKTSATDLVTDADLAAQDAMLALLEEQRPDDAICAEERGVNARPTVTRQWLIDPIDGTLAYVQGIPLWSVVAALHDRDRTLAAAIYDPLADELYSAAADSPVLCNSQPATVPPARALRRSLIRLHCEAALTSEPEFLPAFNRLVSHVGSAFAGGSGSLGLAWVATGRLHAFAELYSPDAYKDWDWLPGKLLVERAGGAAREVGSWRIAAGTVKLADELEAVICG